MIKNTYRIYGTVQGVGFRPSILRWARFFALGGSIENTPDGIQLSIIGNEEQITDALSNLTQFTPKFSSIDSVNLLSTVPYLHSNIEFSISESSLISSEYKMAFPPDLCVCDECLQEIFDSNNRRFKYPFTTCTSCGPRYTVILDTPYDRERTTLKSFALCNNCASEYTDLGNRRFHCETIACPVCGPQLILYNNQKELIDTGDILEAVRLLLKKGNIIAIKGIGGFQLVADPMVSSTVSTLRSRKDRPTKPFAIMARSADIIEEICTTSPREMKELTSEVAPIVILKKKTAELFPHIAPLTNTLGVMLPTSPLHYLLLNPTQGDQTPPFNLLIVTSGNKRNEPICINNDEAFERLSGIADYFLIHNREINVRADDSIVAVNSEPQVWRRGRGFSPQSIKIKRNIHTPVLALGAELKNTISIGFEHEIVTSSHIGDLQTPQALSFLESSAQNFPRFLRKKIKKIAVDLHPDMHSTRLGEQLSNSLDVPLVKLQHHHSHALSLMAEHGEDEMLVFVFDGTGLGADGKIWGAELLWCKENEYQRLATFAPSNLPGGDKAVLEPRRQAFSRLIESSVHLSKRVLDHLGVSEQEAKVWKTQIDRSINCPESHSCGRLFDSFSALLGLTPTMISFEAESAMLLENRASQAQSSRIDIPLKVSNNNSLIQIDWSDAFSIVLDHVFRNKDTGEIALSIHHSIAEACRLMLESSMPVIRNKKVGLTGGVFMNRILTSLVIAMLDNMGFTPVLHRRVPPNDGGISVGQAYGGGAF